MRTLKRTWAEISLNNLEHNYHAIRAHIPSSCRYLGVMKADAYGHGAVPISHALAEMGAEYLAVSNIEEAVQLRRGNLRIPILILGHTPAVYAENMVFMDITQEVHSLQYARELDEALSGTNYILNVHIKLDTGMTRIGFFAYDHEQTLDEVLEVRKMKHLHIEGVFMHFSVADSKMPEDVLYTKMQYERFTALLSQMRACGIEPEICHCCNSGATILYPEFAMDMVRPGIATYGLHPSKDASGVLDLRPVMSLYTSVAQIRTVDPGVYISYGRTYQTEQQRRIAVLPIGYADGLSRALSSHACFTYHGKQAPVVGRICMDMCMVDVTNIPEIQVGDQMTLFGYDEDGTIQPCERLSDAIDTISYELLCGINKRIARFYLRDGRPSEILQYIV